MWSRLERRVTGAAVSASVAGTLPVFLVGALAPQLRAELDFGRSGLGLAVGICQATSATMAWALGRRVVALGAAFAARASAALSAASLLGIAVFARSWVTLVLFLVVCGVANAICQPATNALLAGAVAPARLGLAFGVKLGSIPLGSLIVGLLVSLIAVPLGWRWAFTVCLTLPIATAVLVRRVPEQSRRTGRRLRTELPPTTTPTRALAMLAVGVGFGIGAANVVPGFLVESATESGFDERTAGLMLAAGGLAGVVARIALGVCVGGRARTGVSTVAAMIGAGSGGYLLLTGGGVAVQMLGVVVVFAVGWGWVGLFQYVVVSANPSNPGAATGLTDTGGYLGASLAPAVAGVVADRASFDLVWLLAAGCAVASATLITSGARMARRAGVPLEVPGQNEPSPATVIGEA